MAFIILCSNLRAEGWGKATDLNSSLLKLTSLVIVGKNALGQLETKFLSLVTNNVEL